MIYLFNFILVALGFVGGFFISAHVLPQIMPTVIPHAVVITVIIAACTTAGNWFVYNMDK